MPAPSLLLFDLGGVLIENTTFKRLNHLMSEPRDTNTLKNLWLESSSVRRFELGKDSPYEFAVSFVAEWNICLSPEAFLEEFYSWPSGFYPGARNTLHSLRQRYHIGCLSNSNVLHWEKFDGFKDDFDIAISSHQLGAIKPDENAFSRALETCCVKPSDVYFFDDSVVNIRTANGLGIRAFHVEGFGQLLKVLRTEKLLPN
jgi:HAD superfamily hydrolase (TIGR01509 family)